MKNIHVLPTEKPSRFYSTAPTATKKEGYAFGEHYIPNTRNMFSNHNIYITSDEDINENDYIITKDGRLVQVSYLLSKDLEGASKVIITTDQDLIKDGVQAIDDEFLEWFVKNPSCEEVEVEKWTDYKLENYKDVPFFKYKIIIPKEEVLLQSSIDGEAIWGEARKQETLEELAEKLQEEIKYGASISDIIDTLTKWQQEQDKKMYSEEEVLELLQKALTHVDDGETGSLITAFGKIRPANLFSWFERFKKK